MVNLTTQIDPQAAETKTRKLFAFGMVKVKLSAGSPGRPSPADELRVYGLLVIEDQAQPTEEN